jgi:Pectate lyase superfamily protein
MITNKKLFSAGLAATILFLECISASAYTAGGNGTLSTNGSAADVQAAINAAAAGNTVLLPTGHFSWSSPVKISKDVSLRGAGLSSTTVACSGDNGLLIISNSTPFACIVSGIAFNGSAASGNNQIGIVVDTPALLYDCSFVSNGGLLEMIRFATNGSVIWNWTFYDNDQNEEAISFKKLIGGANGVSPDWTSNDTMGTADSKGTANTYVENCTFNEMAFQALDLDDNSRVVIRHCTFNNSGFSSHGLDTSPYGMRQWEIYDNTFIFSTSGTSMGGNPFPLNINFWFYCRGGTGVIFNNVMPNLSSKQWGNKGSIVFTVFNIRRTSAYIGCQTTWQALHQVGQGYKGGLVLDPVYVWGNTGGTNYNTLNLNDSQPDQCGDGLASAEFIKVNRDVYLGTVKPGYTPYTYPHPLRNGR